MPFQKYFIALVPPEPLLSEIAALKKEISETYNTKSALRSPPHITLHMPFEWKIEKQVALVEKLHEFKFPHEIEIVLNGFSCFEPKVVFIDVVKNDDLNALQKQLVQFMKLHFNIHNQVNEIRAYHPHLTIAFRDLKKTDFYKMMQEYKDKSFHSAFVSGDFCLLKHNGKAWDSFETFKFSL
jgi:2'-5' RNA ligase